jgi:hypothetical protein
MKRPVRSLLCTFFLLVSSAAFCGPQPHCFTTNGVAICHDLRDESIFYDTPKNEVAYNVQTIHDGNAYYTIYHAEPNGKYKTGDTIRAGVAHGTYRFHMPAQRVRLSGPDNDAQSLLDSDGIGGGGNPMAISGLPGDTYFYIFFLGVSDDDRTRNQAAGDWRHYLLEARTKDFVSFDLKTDKGWSPFAPNIRPAALKDTQGEVIRSNTARATDKTQGLIGSMSFVNGIYHYFYVDYVPDGARINLYHRTSVDVSTGIWSPAEIVLELHGFEMIRVAKAKNLDRWAIMYGCYANKVQDICLQYTKTLDVMGPGGLGDLRLTSDDALGFSGNGQARSFSQPYWLTDRWGNLDTVGSDTGGEFYWTDMNPGNCQLNPYFGCPVYGGAVHRAGWGTTPIP